MLSYFGKGEILKGSACDIKVMVFPCGVTSGSVSDFTCAFYTESGVSIEKTFSDFEFDGRYGTVHFESGELDSLADGTIRYKAEYFIDSADWYVMQRASGYYLKTPVDYTPIDFVSRDELDQAVASAMTGSAATQVIENVVSSMTSAITTEIVRLRIPTSLPSSGTGIQSGCEKAWKYFEEHKQNFIAPYSGNREGMIDIVSKVPAGYIFRVLWGETDGGSEIAVYELSKNSEGIYTIYGGDSVRFNSYLWFDEYATSADTVSALTNLGYEISTKQDALVSGTNIKTINGQSILGSGNINIQGGSGGTDYSEEIEALSGASSAHTEQISSLSASTSENTSKIAQISAFTESGFTTIHRDIESLSAGTESAVSGISSDISALSASTQSLETVVASKGNVSSSTINKIWTGTRAQYSAQTIYSTTLYIITD